MAEQNTGIVPTTGLPQNTTLFHVSTFFGEPNGILSHVGTFKAALQHLDGLFGSSATRSFDGFSYTVAEKSGWNAVKSSWDETVVRRETPQQMITAYADLLRRATIYEVEIPNRKPLMLKDCWEADPIGSGGLAIFEGNTDLSEKERAELSEIFGPFDKPIYLRDARRLISAQRLQQMQAELQDDPVFKDHLAHREKEVGKEQVTHNLAAEIVWAHLTLRLRNWALENSYDTLAYKNYSEGDGELSYVTLNEGSIKVIRNLNFDPQGYLYEAIPVVGTHVRKIRDQAIASGKQNIVIPKQFWNMTDTGKYWLPFLPSIRAIPPEQSIKFLTSSDNSSRALTSNVITDALTHEPDYSDSLLNSTLSRFAKIELLKTNNMIPLFGAKQFISTKLGTKIGRLLDKLHSKLASAASYQYLPDAISSVLDDKDFKISNGIILPSPITWIDNCGGKRDKISGALLVDDGSGTISINLFLNPVPHYDQNAHMKRHNIRPIDQMPSLVPYLEQFSTLGENKEPLLIVPNIIFDIKTGSVRFQDKRNSVLPLLVENPDKYPWITNYSEITARFNKNTLSQLNDNWLATAKASLQLAQALANNNPRIKFESASTPVPVNVTVLAGLGKAPTRTASIVAVNPDFAQRAPFVSNAAPATSTETPKPPANEISLVDLVVQSAMHSKGAWRQGLNLIASKLRSNPLQGRYGAKRFVLDRADVSALGRMSALSFEDFTAQHKRIRLPFDPLWMEIDVPQQDPERPTILRAGYLVRNYDDKVTAKYVVEHAVSDADVQGMMRNGAYIRHNRVAASPPVDLIFNENGITTPNGTNFTDTLKKKINADIEKGKLSGEEAAFDDQIINFITDHVRGFYRLLVLISSDNVETNIEESRLDTTPGRLHSLRIKFSDELKRALDADDVESIKGLLGWGNAIPSANSPTVTDELERTFGDIGAVRRLMGWGNKIPSANDPTITAAVPNAGTINNTSLADFVVESGRNSTGDWKAAIYPIGSALVSTGKHGRPEAKRFVFDETVETLLERISAIPFADFAARIGHIQMPYDRMWFEDTLPEEPQGIRKYVQRKGYIVTRTEDTITGRYVAERVVSAHENVEHREAYERSIRALGAYIRNGAAAFSQGIDLVLDKTGITGTGGKSFLEIHEANQRLASERLVPLSPEELAEGTEQNAQYLCRLLVALSSQSIQTNIEESRLDTTPGKLHTLHFELSADLDKALARGDINAAKQLLGWGDEKLLHPEITTLDADINAPAHIALPESNFSLAELVIETGKLSTGYMRAAIRPIGRELIPNPKFGRLGAKRFVFDKTVHDMMDRTKSIPIEDFDAQYKNVIIPSNPIWLETTISEDKPEEEPGITLKIGILAKSSENGFVVRVVRDIIISPNSSPDVREGYEQRIRGLGGYIHNGHVAYGEDIEIISDENGLTTRRGQNFIETYESGYFDAGSTGSAVQLVEDTVADAKWLLRLLVIISSQNVETNAWQYLNDESYSATSSTTAYPLQIALSDEIEEALKIGDIETAKKLLGWSSEESTAANDLKATDLETGPTESTVPSTITPPNNDSLADFFVESGRLSFGYWQEAVRAVGQELIFYPKRGRLGAVRFVLDAESERQIALLSSIDLDEAKQVFRPLCVPFNSIWIETTVPEQEPERAVQRVGYQIKKSGDTISLRLAMEKFIPAESRKNVEIRGGYVRNDRTAYSDGLEVVFSEKEGMTINEGPAARHFKAEYLRHDSANGSFDETALVAARYISRFLLAITSEGVETNIWDLREGQIHGAPTELLPLRFRVSDDILRALEARDYETARKLLGWADETPQQPDVATTISAIPPAADISLAEFVIETGRNATGYTRNTIYPIGRQLVSNPQRGRYGAKRFLLDEKIQALVKQTYCIPFEEFAAQHQQTLMPFDPMWFETTVFPASLENPDMTRRDGFLVRRTQAGIVGEVVNEYTRPIDSTPEQMEQFERNAQALGKYFRDGRAVSSDDVELIFANDRLQAAGGEHFMSAYGRLKQGYLDEDLMDKMLEPSTTSGQAFMRFLVFISSPNVTTNIWTIQNEPNLPDAEAGILHQAEVEISDELKAALEAKDAEAIKSCLGWSDNPSAPHIETAMTEEGRQAPAVFTSIVAVEDDEVEIATAGQGSKPDFTPPPAKELSEDEIRERERKRQEAFDDAKVRLLAEADMFLMQAQSRQLNRFECRIDLNRPGFPIQLLFSREGEVDGQRKITKANFAIDHYGNAYMERGIALTMNDAVDLLIIVQSMIYNTDDIVPIHDPHASGERTEMKAQMPLPILDYKIVQRTNGMYSLILDARDTYDRKKIVHPTIPLGLAARHEDPEAEKRELKDRIAYVLDYLDEIDKMQSPEGYGVHVTRGNVCSKLEAYVKDQNKEWGTFEYFTHTDPELNDKKLIHASMHSNQKISLAPVALRLDAGGDNPSWHCHLMFYIGDKNQKFMGELVRTRVVNLLTRNKNLALARTQESLKGVYGRSEKMTEGFLSHVQNHMRLTGDEWRIEHKGTKNEEVFIGRQPLQFFLDDMKRYELDIGVRLENETVRENGWISITLQAIRSLTGDHGHTALFEHESVFESRDGERKPIAFTILIPPDRKDRIAEFVKAAHEHVRWHADQAYSSIALGVEGQETKRKKPLEYRTSQVRQSVIRAVEELFQVHFDMRLPKDWHGLSRKKDSSAAKSNRGKSRSQDSAAVAENPALG